MNMKLNPHSTRPQIFNDYVHPWYEYTDNQDKQAKLIRPKPPTKEAVERAKFIDKTYKWSGADSVRSRDKRSSS